MRILLINYEYPPLGGGAGNATANTARELAGLGADVLVLTASFSGLPRREERDGFVLERIPALRAHADHCRPHEMLSFTASASAAALCRGKTFRPEAMIAYFGVPCGPPAWLTRVLYGTPYIVSLRGGDVPGFQPYDLKTMHRLTKPVITFLWKRAGHVVANSAGLKELAEQSADGVPIEMIPNGVDTDVFGPASEREGSEGAGRPDRPVRLLFVGRVVFQKGLDVLLDALASLGAKPAWTLDVVGDGPARPGLEERAREHGLDGRIRFLGWKTKEAMPGLYASSDVFVFPSRDEGMPNALLEAMASGLPAAATRISGSGELVRHGETGFLSPPEDADALARGLRELLGDARLRRRMGRAARILAETEYSWKSVAERYLALCRDMR